MVSVTRETLTRGQREVLDIIMKFPGLSINGIGKIAGISRGAVLSKIKYLGPEYIKTRTVGQERLCYLKEDYPDYPEEETDCVLLLEPREKLAKKFALDEFELRMLEELNGNESPQKLAEFAAKLKTVANQIKARLEKSIPAKFDVATFVEAKVRFLKH